MVAAFISKTSNLEPDEAQAVEFAQRWHARPGADKKRLCAPICRGIEQAQSSRLTPAQTEASAACSVFPGVDMGALVLMRSLPVLISALALTACQTPVTQEQSGMVIGRLPGGVAAVILGTLTGVAVGEAVARSMAERDRCMTGMTAQTLETVRIVVSSQPVGTVRNVHVLGSSVRSTAPVAGDFSALGGRVVVDHPVTDDVLVLGGTVDVRAPVGGDLRAAGGDVSVEGAVGCDAMVAAGNLKLTNAAQVAGSAELAGSEVLVEGRVDGSLNVRARRLVLERNPCVGRNSAPNHPRSHTMDTLQRRPFALAVACCGGAAMARPAVFDPGKQAFSENRASRHGPDGKGKGPPGEWRRESPCNPTLLAKRVTSAASRYLEPMAIAATKHAVNRFRKQRHESR
jgi:hypothetical protein